jgi:outer membrane immunogenic protein
MRMRRFHPVALLASATFASGAWAADLPEVPAQEAAALVNWSGVYIGGFFGGGAIVDNIELPGLGSGNFNGIGGEGWLGGGFLGVNWQVAPQWVIGVQGDIGTTGLDTELNIPAAGGNLIDAQPDLTASASVRAGFLPTPDTLVYVIGGYSYAHYNVSTSFLGNFDEDYNGFHIGGGIETRLTHNITGRIEYRYTQYDGEDWGTGGFLNVEPSSHTGTIGIAWTPWAFGQGYSSEPRDLGGWTGFYVGGYFGGGAIVDNIELPGLGSGNFNGVGGEGWLGGGMVGANWQPTPLWVLGLQGDVGTTGLDTELNIPAAGGNLIDAQPDLTASASVRLGFVPMSATMLYVIGGYSYAHYNVSTSFLGNFDEDYNGFHVGGGIETKLTHHLTGRIEYRYTQYGGEDWGTGGFLNVEPSSHTGTLGLTWLFGGNS